MSDAAITSSTTAGAAATTGAASAAEPPSYPDDGHIFVCVRVRDVPTHQCLADLTSGGSGGGGSVSSLREAQKICLSTLDNVVVMHDPKHLDDKTVAKDTNTAVQVLSQRGGAAAGGASQQQQHHGSGSGKPRKSAGGGSSRTGSSRAGRRSGAAGVGALVATGTANFYECDHCITSMDEKARLAMPVVRASDFLQPPPYGSQEDVYRATASRAVTAAVEGVNSCVFAYGQTGSGKTYTLFGDTSNIRRDPGIVPRTLDDLFRQLEGIKTNCEAAAAAAGGAGDSAGDTQYRYSVTLSFFEIYQNDVFCLLSKRRQGPLSVRFERDTEGKRETMVIKDLTQATVASAERAYPLVEQGLHRRQTGETGMNAHSSRSHAILQIRVTQSRSRASTKETTELHSTINLVDLAGSERQRTAQTSGKSREEGIQINQSLATLARVINDISSGAKYVNYRDSLLTMVLRDNLGGNSRTFMIATVSPCAFSHQESCATLVYARDVRKIRNRPTVNRTVQTRATLFEQMARLNKENERLRAQVEAMLLDKRVGETRAGGDTDADDAAATAADGDSSAAATAGASAPGCGQKRPRTDEAGLYGCGAGDDVWVRARTAGGLTAPLVVSSHRRYTNLAGIGGTCVAGGVSRVTALTADATMLSVQQVLEGRLGGGNNKSGGNGKSSGNVDGGSKTAADGGERPSAGGRAPAVSLGAAADGAMGFLRLERLSQRTCEQRYYAYYVPPTGEEEENEEGSPNTDAGTTRGSCEVVESGAAAAPTKSRAEAARAPTYLVSDVQVNGHSIGITSRHALTHGDVISVMVEKVPAPTNLHSHPFANINSSDADEGGAPPTRDSHCDEKDAEKEAEEEEEEECEQHILTFHFVDLNSLARAGGGGSGAVDSANTTLGQLAVSTELPEGLGHLTLDGVQQLQRDNAKLLEMVRQQADTLHYRRLQTGCSSRLSPVSDRHTNAAASPDPRDCYRNRSSSGAGSPEASSPRLADTLGGGGGGAGGAPAALEAFRRLSVSPSIRGRSALPQDLEASEMLRRADEQSLSRARAEAEAAIKAAGYVSNNLLERERLARRLAELEAGGDLSDHDADNKSHNSSESAGGGGGAGAEEDDDDDDVTVSAPGESRARYSVGSGHQLPSAAVGPSMVRVSSSSSEDDDEEEEGDNQDHTATATATAGASNHSSPPTLHLTQKEGSASTGALNTSNNNNDSNSSAAHAPSILPQHIFYENTDGDRERFQATIRERRLLDRVAELEALVADLRRQLEHLESRLRVAGDDVLEQEVLREDAERTRDALAAEAEALRGDNDDLTRDICALEELLRGTEESLAAAHARLDEEEAGRAAAMAQQLTALREVCRVWKRRAMQLIAGGYGDGTTDTNNSNKESDSNTTSHNNSEELYRRPADIPWDVLSAGPTAALVKQRLLGPDGVAALASGAEAAAGPRLLSTAVDDFETATALEAVAALESALRELDGRNRRLLEELQRLEEELRRCEARLASLRDDKAALERDLTRANATEEELAATRAQLAAKEEQIAEAEKWARDVRADLDAAQHKDQANRRRLAESNDALLAQHRQAIAELEAQLALTTDTLRTREEEVANLLRYMNDAELQDADGVLLRDMQMRGRIEELIAGALPGYEPPTGYSAFPADFEFSDEMVSLIRACVRMLLDRLKVELYVLNKQNMHKLELLVPTVHMRPEARFHSFVHELRGVVAEVAGRAQRIGGKWALSESDVFAGLVDHRRRRAWNALLGLLIWYDHWDLAPKTEYVSYMELIRNGDRILQMARMVRKESALNTNGVSTLHMLPAATPTTTTPARPSLQTLGSASANVSPQRRRGTPPSPSSASTPQQQQQQQAPPLPTMEAMRAVAAAVVAAETDGAAGRRSRRNSAVGCRSEAADDSVDESRRTLRRLGSATQQSNLARAVAEASSAAGATPPPPNSKGGGAESPFARSASALVFSQCTGVAAFSRTASAAAALAPAGLSPQRRRPSDCPAPLSLATPQRQPQGAFSRTATGSVLPASELDVNYVAGTDVVQAESLLSYNAAAAAAAAAARRRSSIGAAPAPAGGATPFGRRRSSAALGLASSPGAGAAGFARSHTDIPRTTADLFSRSQTAVHTDDTAGAKAGEGKTKARASTGGKKVKAAAAAAAAAAAPTSTTSSSKFARKNTKTGGAGAAFGRSQTSVPLRASGTLASPKPQHRASAHLGDSGSRSKPADKENAGKGKKSAASGGSFYNPNVLQALRERSTSDGNTDSNNNNNKKNNNNNNDASPKAASKKLKRIASSATGAAAAVPTTNKKGSKTAKKGHKTPKPVALDATLMTSVSSSSPSPVPASAEASLSLPPTARFSTASTTL